MVEEYVLRNYKRRLGFLDNLMKQGKFSFHIFDKYNVKILFKLLYTLENISFTNLEISKSHSTELKTLLGKFLKSKCSIPNHPLVLRKDLLITIFTSPDLDKIGLSSILKSPEVMEALPPCVRKVWSHPLVAFKYVKTLGQKAFNYSDIGRNLKEHNKTAILRTECPCRKAVFSSFVEDSLGHVVTSDCSILPSPSLKELFSKGTKFRLTSSIDSCLLKAIEKGISSYVSKLEESLG
eukprot:c22449_g1_i1 orf=194-904(+)